MHHISTKKVSSSRVNLEYQLERVGMDMLEEAKTKHIIAPGINWLIATLHDAEAVC
jgi:hypothetical protein